MAAATATATAAAPNRCKQVRGQHIDLGPNCIGTSARRVQPQARQLRPRATARCVAPHRIAHLSAPAGEFGGVRARARRCNQSRGRRSRRAINAREQSLRATRARQTRSDRRVEPADSQLGGGDGDGG